MGVAGRLNSECLPSGTQTSPSAALPKVVANPDPKPQSAGSSPDCHPLAHSHSSTSYTHRLTALVGNGLLFPGPFQPSRLGGPWRAFLPLTPQLYCCQGDHITMKTLLHIAPRHSTAAFTARSGPGSQAPGCTHRALLLLAACPALKCLCHVCLLIARHLSPVREASLQEVSTDACSSLAESVPGNCL